MSGLQVIKVESVEALRLHGEPYAKLIASLGRPDAYPFELELIDAVSPYYLAEDQHGSKRSLYFLLAFRGEELVGVAPWMRETKPASRFRVRRIFHYGECENALMVCFPQCLAAPEDKSDCLTEFVAFLRNHANEWDIVDLGYLFLHEELEAYQKLVPDCRIEVDSMKCHAEVLESGFEGFLKGFSSKHRGKNRRNRERLEVAHRDVRFEKVSSLTESQRNSIEELHQKRQRTLRHRGAHRDSLFECPQKSRAFWAADDAFTHQHCSHHYLLYANDRLVAFVLGYQSRNTTYLHLIGMDDDFAEFSPAKLLMLFAYEQEAEAGTREINLLLGTNQLKEHFGRRQTVHHRMIWDNRRWPAALRTGLWRTSQQTKAWFRRIRRVDHQTGTDQPCLKS